MPNIAAIINGHNKIVWKSEEHEHHTKPCICNIKKNCPLSGQYCTEAVVYQATVTNNTAVDIRGTNPEPVQYNNHTASYKNTSKKAPLS